MIHIPHSFMKAISRFFLPQQANGFIPYSLRMRAITIYLLIAVFIKTLSLVSGIFVPTTQFFADVSSQFVIALTNQERTAQGLLPLAENQILDNAACQKAQDMVQNRYFSHDSPLGVDPWHWFSQAGYQYYKAGENLAIDFYQSNDVVTAWMNSPSHRKNMLGDYKDIGLCVTHGNIEGYDTTVVVQLFGSPKAAVRTVPPVPNATPKPSIRPSVAPRPVTSPIAQVSLQPTVEGIHTTEPSPNSATTSRQLLVGSTNSTGLTLSFVKEKPMVFGKAWDTLVNPFWLYAAFLAYLIGIVSVGVFARAYTPNPRIFAGMAVVIFVVIGMMALPSTVDVLHAQARVLPPITSIAK